MAGPDIAVVDQAMRKVVLRKTLERPEPVMVASAKSENQDAVQRAEKIMKDLDEKNWEQRMQKEAGAVIDNEAKLDATVDQISDTGRHDRAVHSKDVAKKFAKEGYDALGDPDKQHLRDMLRAKIKRNPALRDELEELVKAGHNEEDILADMLRDPDYGPDVGKGLTEIPEKHKLSDVKTKAEEAKIAAEESQQKAQTTLDQEKEKLRLKEEKLKEFSNRNGAKKQQFDELEADEASIKADLARARENLATNQDEITRFKNQLEQIESERSRRYQYSKNPDVSDLNTRSDRVNDDLKQTQAKRAGYKDAEANAQAKQEQLTSLRAERDTLESDIAALKENIKTYETDLKNAQGKTARETTRFDAADKVRTAEEEDLTDSFDNLLSRTMDKRLQERLKQNAVNYRAAREQAVKDMETDAQKTKDEAQKKKLETRAKDEAEVSDYMWRRYHKAKTPKKKLLGKKDQEPFEFDTDKDKIEAEFNGLFGKNADATVDSILTDFLGHTPITAAERQQFAGIVTREIIGNRVTANGQLTAKHAEYMRHLPWFRAMVEEGIQFNRPYAESLQKLVNEPLLDENGQPTERAKRMGAGQTAATLLTVLMGMQGLVTSVVSDEKR